MEKSKTVLIVAGEASGDAHAASLVREIKKINPDVKFFGLGGEKLQQEGVQIYFNLANLAVVGIFEVIKNLKLIHNIFQNILSHTDRIKPDMAILVDYPGFNLRLAKELHKKNIPVIYYVSPQIWAWGQGRIKTIKENVTKMMVFFPFEEELYKKHNVDVSFVGHPSLDSVKITMPKEDFNKKFGLNPNQFTIAILPGSREKEVKSLLPIMLSCAELIQKQSDFPIQFLILRSPTVKENLFSDLISKYNINVKLITNMTYDGLAASNFAIVCSGTATLETAILGVPMVILYKVNLLTWAYVRLLIKIPYIGLVNVINKSKFIEEFIQFNTKPHKISEYVSRLINNKPALEKIKKQLEAVKNALGEKGASEKAAKVIADFLRSN